MCVRALEVIYVRNVILTTTPTHIHIIILRGVVVFVWMRLKLYT